ncbi:MAG: winged helix-turn-helix domain-containing protein [Acidobacteria bacterium]|nr:winged helix-turn-helix domain-containing protein [Acidobacteriota bacterium]
MQSTGGFAYGAFRLDPRARSLVRDRTPIPLKRLQFDILHILLSRPGEMVTKDELMKAGWGERIVSDDSIAQAVSRLRRVPGIQELGAAIETVTRQGYRFEPGKLVEAAPAPTERVALGLPHRAFMDGRAALLTLTTTAIEDARGTFARLVELYPLKARYHVGFANACALLHESKRATPDADIGLLRCAEHHAIQARDLDGHFAEAWATLGFVLDRLGDNTGAIEALLEAVELQRDNWRHWLRLAYASWGQLRLDAVMEVIKQVPGCPMAHCLAAMVWIARNSLDKAECELDLALARLADDSGPPDRSPLVALYWMKGLLCLARGDVDLALDFLRREVDLEDRGHLYARECCANAWYAIGVCRMRGHDRDAARSAFNQARARVPGHPMATLGLEILDGMSGDAAAGRGFDLTGPMAGERALAHAARMSYAGDRAGAARLIAAAVRTAPAGSTGWLIPIEPLLGLRESPERFAGALEQLSQRAL